MFNSLNIVCDFNANNNYNLFTFGFIKFANNAIRALNTAINKHWNSNEPFPMFIKTIIQKYNKITEEHFDYSFVYYLNSVN